jgi:hypothetical protein
MIDLLSVQSESDIAYRRWVDALLAGSQATDRGWVIDGNGIVKIVQPKTAQQDKGKLTVVGRDQAGRIYILREGWLKKNPLSGAVRKEFAVLSGLARSPVSVAGKPSGRDWYVVAALDGDDVSIVDQTVAFVHACSLARSKTGGGTAKHVAASETYRLGLDEKGRVTKVTTTGGTKQVVALQGFVWEELKRLVGDALSKPTRDGYAVDAMIMTAKLLIEIKTGVSARDVYEAVGQLALYPSLIALPSGLKPVLLVPDKPALRPQMAAALAKALVEVQFYSVGMAGKKPEVAFSPKFLDSCRTAT